MEQGRSSSQPEWLYAVSAINHLMLMFNSSVNFVIYCAVGSRFRNALSCHGRRGGGSSYVTTSRRNTNNANTANSTRQVRWSESTYRIKALF